MNQKKKKKKKEKEKEKENEPKKDEISKEIKITPPIEYETETNLIKKKMMIKKKR